MKIKSIDSATLFSGEEVIEKSDVGITDGPCFVLKYFTPLKKQKRDSKGRFLGAEPAKAKPFTPDSIVAGAKYTNSKYPSNEYFGVVLAGAKEMLMKTDWEERFTVCFKGEHCEGNFWESFSEKVEK